MFFPPATKVVDVFSPADWSKIPAGFFTTRGQGAEAETLGFAHPVFGVYWSVPTAPFKLGGKVITPPSEEEQKWLPVVVRHFDSGPAVRVAGSFVMPV